MTTCSQVVRGSWDGRSATLSQCRRYRYDLWRVWDAEADFCAFVGLNPSTADETKDDPTIRRCSRFAHDWGFGGVCMLNLFAFRATKPDDMKRATDPVGPDNDRRLREIGRQAALVVAAWGVHGCFMGRDLQVRALLPDLHVLRLTKDGFPGHPLYLPADLEPRPWMVGAQ